MRISSKIAITTSATSSSSTIGGSIQGIRCFDCSIHNWRSLYWRFGSATLKNNFLIVKKAKEVIKRAISYFVLSFLITSVLPGITTLCNNGLRYCGMVGLSRWFAAVPCWCFHHVCRVVHGPVVEIEDGKKKK
ncbi:hypothetical protein NL676_032358 [Syzygium grande]|nr:hypothetical protein NL676_032358 [Syzygium grande]